MDPRTGTAKALATSHPEMGKPLGHLPSKAIAHEKLAQGLSREDEGINNSHAQYITKVKPSLEYVVPARTLPRSLSLMGRKSILNRFRQRRSVQRHALINRTLKGLEPAEVQAVYKVNPLRKEFERSGIDQLRMIWKGQAHWPAIEPGPLLVPESAEGAWQVLQRAEETQCMSSTAIVSHAEALSAPRELEPWGPTQPWGSNGAVCSPGHCNEWGGMGKEIYLMEEAEENGRECQEQHLEEDAQ